MVTFGDMCVDLIVSGDDMVPRFGQVEQLVGDYALEMGGSCCIFACQAARLGLRVGILGRVGDDDFGRLVLRRLHECGVDTRHVIVDPALKTGLGIALCQEDDRAILTYLGSISAIEPDDVDDEFLVSARHLHHGSFFLHSRLRPAMPAIFGRARALGLTTSLDTNWDPDERWNSTLHELLPLTDVFLPNEQEALHISGAASLADAVKWFQRQGVSIVALKRGETGAGVYQGEEEHTMVLPQVMGGDSIGAGDSFDAGFLAGWLRDLPLDRCLSIASHCGRSVAGASGGLQGQLTWEAVLEVGLAFEHVTHIKEKQRLENPLWADIHAQGENLRHVVDHLFGAERRRLQEAAQFLQNGKPIVFAGMASAAYTCVPAEFYLGQYGRYASTMGASDALYSLLPALKGVNVVVNSRSGETAEIVKLGQSAGGSRCTVPSHHQRAREHARRPSHSHRVESHAQG